MERKSVVSGCSGGCSAVCSAVCGSSCKLSTCDWLSDLPIDEGDNQYVEVQFKNTRKGYYQNEPNLILRRGDLVAVEANPGHDIGTVTLTGKLVLLQMRKHNMRAKRGAFRRVHRLAHPVDLERYTEARSREADTMLRARRIVESEGIPMKIGDVEYQGDGTKAVFYYFAEDRIDFRQLVKLFSEAFQVRIEMKQIGARQEAGMIGGIGLCGREFCCSSWMSTFMSVSIEAAHCQDTSMNPQQLAGQCGKLKCCFNYEVDTYAEAMKQMPSKKVVLETRDRVYYHFKTDVFKRELTYSTERNNAANTVTISAVRAFEIIEMNRRGIRPDALKPEPAPSSIQRPRPKDLLDDSLKRFDSATKRRKKKHRSNRGDKPKDHKP